MQNANALDALKLADSATKIAVIKQLSTNEPSALVGFLVPLSTLAVDPDVNVKLALLQLFKDTIEMKHTENTREPAFTAITDTLTVISATETNTLILKKCISVSSKLYKAVFLASCTNRIRTGNLWDKTKTLKSQIVRLLGNTNEGVRVMVIKFIADFIEIQIPSDDPHEISPAMIGRSHAFLNSAELENESNIFLKNMIDILKSNLSVSTSIFTAIMNGLHMATRKRPRSFSKIIPVFLELGVDQPTNLSLPQNRSFRKTVKNILISYFKSPDSYQYHDKLEEILVGELSTKSYEIQIAVRKRDIEFEARKRSAHESNHDRKRQRVDSPPALDTSEHILSTYDVTKFPLPIVIELVYQTLLTVSPEQWTAAIQRYVRSKYFASSPLLQKTNPSQQHLPSHAALEDLDQKREPVLPQILTKAETKPENIEIDTKKEEAQSVEVSEDILARYEESLHKAVSSSDDSNFEIREIFDSLLSQGESVDHSRPWMLLVVRYITRGNRSINETLKTKLLEFIMNDFDSFYELGNLWLLETFYLDTIHKTEDYVELLDRFLEKMQSNENDEYQIEEESSGTFKEEVLSKFFQEIPQFSDQVFAYMENMCEDLDMSGTIMNVLRDLVQFRPNIKTRCLEILLKFATNSIRSIRSNSILIVRKWYLTDKSITDTIQDSALSSMKALSQKGPDFVEDSMVKPEGVKLEEGETMDSLEYNGWSTDDIIRHLEFYLSMCSKNIDLFKELFDLYPSLPNGIQNVINQQIVPLVTSLTKTNAINQVSIARKLWEYVVLFPRECTELLLKIFEILCTVSNTLDKGSFENFLKVKIFEIGDARFYAAAIEHMDREDVHKALPGILDLLDGSSARKEYINHAVTAAVKSRKMSPNEVFVMIHNMEETLGLKRCVEATSLCMAIKELFTQEVLSACLQVMAEQPKIPTLYMRTVIQCVNMYPAIKPQIKNLMMRLITKRIWTNDKLWEGYVRLCMMIAPLSYEVIIALPKSQVEDVLKRMPKLKDALKQYIDEMDEQKRFAHGIQQVYSLLM